MEGDINKTKERAEWLFPLCRHYFIEIRYQLEKENELMNI